MKEVLGLEVTEPEWVEPGSKSAESELEPFQLGPKVGKAEWDIILLKTISENIVGTMRGTGGSILVWHCGVSLTGVSHCVWLAKTLTNGLKA